MFGLVVANPKELSQEELARYRGHYCGVCKAIGRNCSQGCRLALNYDITFLSLLLSSLYEPEETEKKAACWLHPVRGTNLAENEIIDYAAMMNVALAYYSCRDNWQDDRNLLAWAESEMLSRKLSDICGKYPRQCAAMEACICELNALEKEACPNPDESANCFGRLMAELFLYRKDYWEGTLYGMGMSLGRFIYLADASIDLARDQKRKTYNPFLLLGAVPDPSRREQYLVLEMAECTRYFEKLPLVQDKSLLDKILYSGIWAAYRKKMGKKREDTNHA